MICPTCNDKRYCTYCDGTGSGKKHNPHPQRQFVDGKGNVTCSYCKGNKKCVNCNGTGRV